MGKENRKKPREPLGPINRRGEGVGVNGAKTKLGVLNRDVREAKIGSSNCHGDSVSKSMGGD